MTHRFENWIRVLCRIFFGFFLCFLAVHSLFFTAEIKSNETMQYLRDRPLVHFLVIGLIMLLLLLMKQKQWSLSNRTEDRLVLAVMIAVAFASVMIVRISKSLPIFDQQLCVLSANALAAGDYGQSVHFYYLDYFPFQLPWVLFLSVISLLGGAENLMLYQYANVLANLISIWALAECAVLLFDHRGLRLLTWLSAFAFLPLMFYTPFIYGNLYGLCFMLLGARSLLLYLRAHTAHHLIKIIVFLTVATLLKKNFSIAVFAAFLVLITDALRSKRIVAFLAAALLMAAGFGGNSVILAVTNYLTGADLSQGFPLSSFVMIGLQEEPGHEPGWHNDNGYKIYVKSEYNAKKADEMAWESIRERLAVFADDPSYIGSFFYRKLISQWDEPSFQSLWVNEMARNPERGALALSLYERGKAGNVVLWWMNQYHSILLVGAVLWFFLDTKKRSIGTFFFPLYFVGGCLFHLLWEAKGQYTIFCFFCLIPYAVMGYLIAIRRLHSVLRTKGFAHKPRRM